MRGALVIALCATGCFSDRGLVIEVDVGGTGATSVELFIGTDHCNPDENQAGIDCMSIAPPPHGEVSLHGTISFGDALPPYTADVKGHTATFQLKSDTARSLPIVIAVGTKPGSTDPSSTATLYDLPIPTNDARVIAITLQPASLLDPDTMATNGEDRVRVWRKPVLPGAPVSPGSCVVVEHGGTSPVSRDFVVPSTDPDCDSANPDCNPAAYMGTNMVPGARTKPGCFSTAGGPACTLGAFGCVDNVGYDNTCSPLPNRTCVPGAFCACTSYNDNCIRSEIPVGPRIECRVPTKLTLGKLGLCVLETPAPTNLDIPFMNTKCPQPELGSLQGTSFDTSYLSNGVMMQLSSPSRPCEFTVTASGTPTASPFDDVGFLRFPSETGPTLLLPIVFHFLQPQDNCLTADFRCDYIFPTPTIDTLWSCVQ